jgi:prolipoprotein diacylglyceryl transferase
VRVNLASIPSPTTAVWHLGPFPLRAYALCIIAGVIAAVLISDRRLQARGGPKGAIMDIAVYAVPAGIIGARIYHVITSPQDYFGEGGHPVDALKIWEGGLGIWGAIAGGALGAWYAARKLGIPLTVVADAVAPGLLVAQAIGRFGNWFNNELYGRRTTLPWGLEVYFMDPSTGRAQVEGGEPVLREGLYHPTFLYEALWCLGAAAVVIWADKRFTLSRGRAFALYCMLYVVGRVWIEALRIDEANRILGLRLNIWTCVIVFGLGLWYFLTHRGPRERLVVNEDGTVRVLTGDTATPADGAEPAAEDDRVTDESADDEPAAATAEQRDAERSDAGGPDAARSDAERSDAERSDAERSDAERAGAEKPDAEQADVDSPAAEPPAAGPAASEPPAAARPDADDPGTEKADARAGGKAAPDPKQS